VSKLTKGTSTSINVYCFDKKRIVPLEISKKEKEIHIDLMYLSDKDHEHYCWIRDLSRLVRSQITKHEEKIFLCKTCLNYFSSAEKLKKNKTYCDPHK